MPTYVFKNDQTGETFDRFMGISESEEFLKNNPHIHKLPTVPNISYSYTTKRIDDGFKEVLSKINNSGVVDPKKSTISHLL